MFGLKRDGDPVGFCALGGVITCGDISGSTLVGIAVLSPFGGFLINVSRLTLGFSSIDLDEGGLCNGLVVVKGCIYGEESNFLLSKFLEVDFTMVFRGIAVLSI
eukprot:NODE_338_length_9271_cov_0.444178.p7 type:complete len:104 gc:universal NODE_338_length_9271_cov_0.444178:7223-6912(-)